MKIVVTGGTGLIGAKLVKNLRQQGHDIVPASPLTGVNALTGEGLAEAMTGAHEVVDVATELARVAEAAPLNGVVDMAGPEPIGMDELVRRFLRAKNDARQVITDVAASHFGTPVTDQSLVPIGPTRSGPTRFDEWLSQAAPGQ